MPRQKQAAPSRTSKDERAAASWTLQDLQLPAGQSAADVQLSGQSAADVQLRDDQSAVGPHGSDQSAANCARRALGGLPPAQRKPLGRYEEDTKTGMTRPGVALVTLSDDSDGDDRKSCSSLVTLSDSDDSRPGPGVVTISDSDETNPVPATLAISDDDEADPGANLVTLNHDDDVVSVSSAGTPPPARRRASGVDREYARLADTLAKFDYYVTVRCGGPAARRVVGSVELTLREPPSDLPAVTEFWVYVSESPRRSVVYFEWRGLRPGSFRRHVERFQCLDAEMVPRDEVWHALSGAAGNAEAVVRDYSPATGLLRLDIQLTEKVFVRLDHPSEAARRANASFRALMRLLLGLPDREHQPQPLGKFDAEEVYSRAAALRRAEPPPAGDEPEPQHEHLLPRLRQYQRRAVLWMVRQERRSPADPTRLHPLYVPLTLDGDTVYYCPLGGWAVRQRPSAVAAPPGGILADEMGLGKTVEVLALVLINAREDPDRVEPLEPVDLDAFEAQARREEAETVRLKRARSPSSSGENSPAGLRRQSRGSRASPSGSDSESDPCEYSGPRLSRAERLQQRRRRLSGDDAPPEPSPADDSPMSAVAAADTAANCIEDVIVRECYGGVPPADYVRGLGVLPAWDSFARRLMAGNEARPRKKKRAASPPPAADPVAEAIEAVIARECYNGRPPANYRRSVARRSAASSARQLAQLHYERTLAAMSSCRPAPPASPRPDPDFSCLCGRWQDRRRYRVRCTDCGTRQHAECVQYDVRDPLRGAYACPQCWAGRPAVRSGATLIVSPASICDQWVAEIEKHVRRAGLRVLVYRGVRSDQYLQPRTLAAADLVVTTYTVLQRELNYAGVGRPGGGEAGKRRAQRYLPPPTPLLCVDWWRVCLDEAQMVECTNTRTAEMALKLRCVNRWCVTGTPLSRSVQDLYGLLLFLGAEPVWSELWWQQLVYFPYLAGDAAPLHRLLQRCMWRTAKADVLHQIGLPAQAERTERLAFSPVEAYFYRRQHDECSRAALAKLATFNASDGELQLRDLERSTVNQLLRPLLRLRQACCHPQVGRGQLVPLNKSTLTMEQLLEQMIRRVTNEAEEAHRQRTAAINGLAALHVVRGRLDEAVEMYRTVLRQADELRDRLKTDMLQRLHALHNLAELLSSGRSQLLAAPTTRDHRLRDEADELRTAYMGRHSALVETARSAAAELTADADGHAAKLDAQGELWFAAVLAHAAEPQELVERVSQQLRDLSVASQNTEKQADTGVTKRTKTLRVRAPHNTMLDRFSSPAGLQLLLVERLTQLAELRELTQKALADLRAQAPAQLLHPAMDCHLRPGPGDTAAADCPLCAAHAHFEQYERQLFYMLERRVDGGELRGVDGQVSVLGELRRGNWGDNETERVLKTLLSGGRAAGAPQHLLQLGAHHVAMLDAMKKEFRALRVLWVRLRDRVSAADELEMAVLRLRTRYPDEPAPEPAAGVTHVIDPHQVDEHVVRLTADRAAAEADLRRRLGQRLYLCNLQRSGADFRHGNVEPCPICETALGANWAVLQCGHCFCMQCVQRLMDECYVGGRRGRLRCAICRDTTRHADIAYVGAGHAEDAAQDVEVLGSHSTKVEAVVRCVLTVLRAEPAAKALVFATWTDALDVIAGALQQNGVEARRLHAPNRRQQALREFRTGAHVSVLLLPINSGANGLNLTEATHVILTNPTLDPGAERQAVGRVHRIGQRRATTVHRLVVRDTIEERVLALNAHRGPTAAACGDGARALTLANLRQLFVDEPHDDAAQTSEQEQVTAS